MARKPTSNHLPHCSIFLSSSCALHALLDFTRQFSLDQKHGRIMILISALALWSTCMACCFKEHPTSLKSFLPGKSFFKSFFIAVTNHFLDRIIFGSVFYAGVIILAAYSASLTSILAVHKEVLPFTDFQSLFYGSSYDMIFIQANGYSNQIKVINISQYLSCPRSVSLF